MTSLTIKQGDDFTQVFRLQYNKSNFQLWLDSGKTGDLDAYWAELGIQTEDAFLATLYPNGLPNRAVTWNLTGLTVTYQLRSGDVLAPSQPTVTTTIDGVEGAAFGRVLLGFTGAQTAALAPGEYIGQMQVRGSKTYSAATDTITVEKDVNLA